MAAVLDALVEEDLARDTLVLFMSDNGGAAHMRNTPLRGRKGNVWEGGHRVPALAWWPGTIEAGTRTDTLCWSLDVFPTMLELAGTASPRPLDGRSLVPVLEGRGDGAPRQLFWLGRAMRDGDWKLVLNGEDAALHFFLANQSSLRKQLFPSLAPAADQCDAHPERVCRGVHRANWQLLQLLTDTVQGPWPEGC